MDASKLSELYFRTTLELRDDAGQLFRITPADSGDATSVKNLLHPFSDAFILTGENPESSGEFSAEQNRAATAQLHQLLDESPVVFRECPGYAFDTDHVELGFAILAHHHEVDTIRTFAQHIAVAFRQNAIFHLDESGLSIIGVLRQDLSGHRPVVVERI